MGHSRRVAGVAVFVAAALVLIACGGDKGEPSGGATSPPTGGTTVAVTLQEWAVLPQPAAAPAGSVTFNVTNKGAMHKHEFVVVRPDLAPNALPTKADGSVDESGAGITSLGEIEEFPSGDSMSKTFALTAGKYVLFCNVVEEEAMADMGGIKAHYKLGMFASFDVS